MTYKSHQPQCVVCGRRGLLDNDLCAICYKTKYGKWSNKFIGERDKKGNPKQNPMKFKKIKRRNKKKK